MFRMRVFLLSAIMEHYGLFISVLIPKKEITPKKYQNNKINSNQMKMSEFDLKI